MKKTLLERISDLKDMINNFEHPEKVQKEVKSIFGEIHKLEDDNKEKRKAMAEMANIAIYLMKKLNMDLDCEDCEDDSEDIEPVTVKVQDYLDVTFISVSSKVTYSELMFIINKARNDFEENLEDLHTLELSRRNKEIRIRYKNDKHKEIIINMSTWNLDIEVIKVYVEGLVEYITK